MDTYGTMALGAVLALSVTALVASHRADWQQGNWIFKPIASTAMVGLGVVCWDGGSHGARVLAALTAFWVSDMLLIPKGRKHWFLGGMAAAFAGHFLYVFAFSSAATAAGTGAALVGLLVPAGLALRWLLPHLEGPMRTAVPLYALTFATMVATATSFGIETANPLVPAGALVFMVSDLAVARHRFVQKTWLNKLWGLPMYYAGQAMIALSLAV